MTHVQTFFFKQYFNVNKKPCFCGFPGRKSYKFSIPENFQQQSCFLSLEEVFWKFSEIFVYYLRNKQFFQEIHIHAK